MIFHLTRKSAFVAECELLPSSQYSSLEIRTNLEVLSSWKISTNMEFIVITVNSEVVSSSRISVEVREKSDGNFLSIVV